MCGVFGYVGASHASTNIMLEGLRELEYRGYDSWGIAWRDKNSISIKKNIGKVPTPNGDRTTTTCAIGHTRWATHGGITTFNAHPHVDCSGNIALIHNGIVENYLELKQVLIEKGHKFVSETDSEVAVHLIEELYKTNSIEKAVRLAFAQMTGLNAVVVMIKDQNKLVACKNSSPLVLGQKDGHYFIASDVHALDKHATSAYFMHDQEMAIISSNHVELLDTVTGKSKKISFKELKNISGVAEKGNYKHYLIKEINEQSDLLKYTANREKEIKKFARFVKKYNFVDLSGCGTAYHASMMGSYFLNRIAGVHASAQIASEYYPKVDTLPIFLSQSGETIDIILTAQKIANSGQKVAALVNREHSTLARLADSTLLLEAGIEKSVLATKSFFAKVALTYLVAHAINGSFKQGQKSIVAAAADIAKILSIPYYKTHVKPVVKYLSQTSDIFIIGRGYSYPLALEAALKLKESTYIHAEGFAGGELKHGVIALIEKGVPCIVFAPNDEHYEEIISNAIEIKSRGGHIIGISHINHPCFDQHLPITDNPQGAIFSNIVVPQLLAYYTTIALKQDPDKPRNLAKSVTVK